MFRILSLRCTAAWLMLVVAWWLPSEGIAESPRPNILLILTDDQGWPTLGCYGGKHVATPHLDRLAAEGVKFTDAYVTSQCTPTRASLLTGQYTARHGLWHVLPWYGYPWARVSEPMFGECLSRDTFTLAKGLRDRGYATAIFGKWHLTNDADGNYMGLRPEASHHYGFDYAPEPLGKAAFAEGQDRGVALLTQQTIDFIQSHQEQPWFCFLSHHMIHGVVVAPEAVTEKYRRLGYGDTGPNRAVYLAGLECIDRSVGQLLDCLDQLGITEQTLILFLSDNGGIDQKLQLTSIRSEDDPPALGVELQEYDNAPLRAGKGSTYEGGIRVPMIARWPTRIPPQSNIDTPVHVVDVLPTLLDAAGASVPGPPVVDGHSLLNLMMGQESEKLKERPIFQYYPFYDLRWGQTPNASVRLGNYKLIEFYGDRFDSQHRYQPGNHIELYDLDVDIGETNNLASTEPLRVQQMKRLLDDWIESVGAQKPVSNPHHAPGDAFRETRERPPWLVDPRGHSSQ